ncbi:hypothetical protein T492DRAFT_1141130 [Pavlovales sp. CCMP2436]|nr:hypothetical protein T492DRAFT_1141130 [Pavlovales sp. CCMP2436]
MSTDPAFPLFGERPHIPVVVIDRKTDLADVGAGRLTEADTVACSAEGVDLRNLGDKLSLATLATPDACFLFDILDLQVLTSARLTRPPAILRAPTGDGRHLVSLSDTLALYGCKPKAPRDQRVFASNPAFWATRPCSEKMKNWAVEHVEHLFELQVEQLRTAELRGGSVEARCYAESVANLCRFRTGFSDTIEIHPSQMGPLIGHGGSNIRRLETMTNSFFATRDGPPATVIIHSPSQMSLSAAISAVEKYKKPAPIGYVLSYFEGYDVENGYGVREYGYADFSEDYAGDWYYRSAFEN